METLVHQPIWTKIEEELREEIPVHVKNIFNLQNIKPLALKVIEDLQIDDFITEIEGFVRKIHFFRSIPQNAKLQDFFGDHHEDPDRFEFSQDDKKCITNIIQLMKSNPENNWRKEDYIPEEIMDQAVYESTLLNMLIRSKEVNEGKDPGGIRYERSLQLVAMYLYMVGGKINYETLSANLCIPKLRSVQRYISEGFNKIIEGSIRLEDLKKFLISRKLPLTVWLSEDATRIVSRIQYDVATNQLVGLVLPIDATNATPICKSCMATSAEVIERICQNNKVASYLYVIVAQTTVPNQPPFCLQIFGWDNCLLAEQVQNRWKHIETQLQLEGIQVRGFSADGDSRLLKSMRVNSKLGRNTSNLDIIFERIKDKPLFHEQNRHDLRTSKKYLEVILNACAVEMFPKHIYVQDFIHLANKLKNRLFTLSIVLPMGKFIASSGHMQTIYSIYTKDKHRLAERDISVKDKMNFKSTMLLCHPRIWKLLQNITGSEATIVYLQIMYFSTHAFISKTLTVLQRIYYMWYALFYVRLWKVFIRKHEKYTLVKHFITNNSYVCFELNAHALLNEVFYCLENDCMEKINFHAMCSQPCENTFRSLRSITSTLSTVVNCTVLEALHRTQRIQLISEIGVHPFKDWNEEIKFPRAGVMNASMDKETTAIPNLIKFGNVVNLRTVGETLLKAKKNALEKANSFGMKLDLTDADKVEITDVKMSDGKRKNVSQGDTMWEEQVDADSDLENEEIEEIDEDDRRLDDEITQILDATPDPSEYHITNNEEICLKDYSSSITVIDEKSPYVEYTMPSGTTKVVKKTTLVWWITKDGMKLSNDRLSRVKQVDVISQHQTTSFAHETASDNIYRGDWCLFRMEYQDAYLVGHILDFVYYGKVKKLDSCKFKKSFVDLQKYKPPPNVEANAKDDSGKSGEKSGEKNKEKDAAKHKNLGAICDWFLLGDDGGLTYCPTTTHGYHDVQYYKYTMPKPTIKDGKLSFCPEIVTRLKNLKINLKPK